MTFDVMLIGAKVMQGLMRLSREDVTVRIAKGQHYTQPTVLPPYRLGRLSAFDTLGLRAWHMHDYLTPCII